MKIFRRKRDGSVTVTDDVPVIPQLPHRSDLWYDQPSDPEDTLVEAIPAEGWFVFQRPDGSRYRRY